MSHAVKMLRRIVSICIDNFVKGRFLYGTVNVVNMFYAFVKISLK